MSQAQTQQQPAADLQYRSQVIADYEKDVVQEQMRLGDESDSYDDDYDDGHKEGEADPPGKDRRLCR